MLLAHKIALDPTPIQRNYFARAAGTARFTWNWALNRWNEIEKAGGKPDYAALSREFTQIYKTEYPWVSEVLATAHTRVFLHLNTAFREFWKKKRKRPRFHGKKSGKHDSFYIQPGQLKLDGKRVAIPLLGWVKMRESLRFEGKIQGSSVSRQGNRWYIAIQVNVGEVYRRERTDNHVSGVDLGISALATIANESTTEQVSGPKPLEFYLRKKRYLGRELSRRTKGSKNWWKTVWKIRRLDSRIANLRKESLHTLTTRLCRENQAIGIEDLNVREMSANRKLARRIADMGFYEFRRQLDYKAALYDTHIVIADRWFPSSKACSRCGAIKEDLTLSQRVFRCDCGFAENRDVNAANNLRTLAQSETDACGHDG